MNIPEEAVEAAAKQMAVNDRDILSWVIYQSDAQRVLEAAAPHMLTRITNAVINRAYEDGRTAALADGAGRP